MSWIKCDNCRNHIDSDEDPDAFIEVNDVEVTWCESCREKYDEEQERTP